MNRNLIRRYRWKDDPENPGGGGSPAPSAGGDVASADPPVGEPNAEKDPDPYLTDHRLHPSLRVKEETKPEAQPEAPTGEPAPPKDPEPPKPEDKPKEEEEEYSEKVKKRIGKEVRKTHEEREGRLAAEKRAADLEARLAKLEQHLGPKPVPDGTPLPQGQILRVDAQGKPQKPKPEDYMDEETGLPDPIRYAEAVAEYKLDAYKAETRESQARTEAVQATAQAWEAEEARFKAKVPDYDEVVGNAEELFFDQDGQGNLQPKREAAILINEMTSRRNPALVYVLSQDEALSERLMGLRTRPGVLKAALDQIEAKIAAEGFKPRPAKEPKPSGEPPKKPPPPPPVPPKMPKGSGGGDEVFTESSVKGKSPQWMAAHDNQINNAIRAGTFYGR